jgi:hypothetical protein
MGPSNFKRLIRFRNPAGNIHYGEVDTIGSTLEKLLGETVPVFRGQSPWDDDFSQTSEREEIAEVSLMNL